MSIYCEMQPRVLWKKYNTPEDEFLTPLCCVRKKGPTVSYEKAIMSSLVVSHEICSCLILIAAFFGLDDGALSTNSILSLSTALSGLAYLLQLHCQKPSLEQVQNNLWIALSSVVIVWLVTPVVASLTSSVATDTIHATSTIFLVFHLLLYNYGVDVAVVNATVSHNLGLFASVCLASRLKTHYDVFGFLTLAVIMFTLFPGFRRQCQVVWNDLFNALLACILVVSSGWMLLAYSPSLFFMLPSAVLLSNCFVPILFVYFQHHKVNIYGPWDEASISESSTVVQDCDK